MATEQKFETGSQNAAALEEIKRAREDGWQIIECEFPHQRTRRILIAAVLLLIGSNVFTLAKLYEAKMKLSLASARAIAIKPLIADHARQEQPGSEDSLIKAVKEMPDSLFKANLLVCCAFHEVDGDSLLGHALKPIAVGELNTLRQPRSDEATNMAPSAVVVTNVQIYVRPN